MVEDHRSAAVVHEYPRITGDEFKLEGLPGSNRLEFVLWTDHGRMKVHRMRHRCRQLRRFETSIGHDELDRIALADSYGWTGYVAAEGPDEHLHAIGDLLDFMDDVETNRDASGL